MKTVILRVEGMTCEGCVRAVTRVLERAGAQDVQVSLDQERARFLAPDDASLQPYIAAIEKAGYRATPENTG
ncbi:MAG: heavy-metal-associated domain-containing protein [Candidatus Hydrothermae bacterium]|nr:heavy-metal-associated domain-containing protein [Candidatus Hydrothermae bacterium]